MGVNHGRILSVSPEKRAALEYFCLFLPIIVFCFVQNPWFLSTVNIIREKLHNGKKKMGREMQDITKLKINLEILYLIGYNREKGCGSSYVKDRHESRKI